MRLLIPIVMNERRNDIKERKGNRGDLGNIKGWHGDPLMERSKELLPYSKLYRVSVC